MLPPGAAADPNGSPRHHSAAADLRPQQTPACQIFTPLRRHPGPQTTALFPWLKLNADVDAGRVTTSGRQEGNNIILQPVESAARQLVELSLHYLVNQPGRICVVGQGFPLPGSDVIAASPRMIAFVDAGPGTRFLPQAA